MICLIANLNRNQNLGEGHVIFLKMKHLLLGYLGRFHYSRGFTSGNIKQIPFFEMKSNFADSNSMNEYSITRLKVIGNNAKIENLCNFYLISRTSTIRIN